MGEHISLSKMPILSERPEDFESPLSVEMRRLYTKLRPVIKRDSIRSFMITSAERGEGKSTTSSNLAVAIARHRDTKTVLVDGDLRRPTLHKLMSLPRERGLSDLLEGKCSIEETLHDTVHPSLKVITCGTRVTSPGSLFDTDQLTRVIEGLESRFEMVVFDAPPVLPVADPVMLAQEVDGVIIVVMAGLTPREVVRRARDVLDDGRASLLGVVLNNAAEVLPYYYDYSYYGYE